ncbi:MAG: hypothetical protein OXT70_12850 [Chloroflexota bacterium]|nr:hypothetical protein [Chloroflexota bacterium]
MERKTRLATLSPSVIADLLFGEEPLDNYFVDGRLIRTFRLPVGGLGLLTVGFRITDRPREKWTRRFNRFRYGEPAAIRAATRTFCAAFEDFRPAGDQRVVVVSSVSSGQNIVQDDAPASILASALAASRGWEWLPHHVTKDRHPSLTGLASAAERDAAVHGVYLAAPIGGEPGLVLVVDDFCTRGATLADIARAIRQPRQDRARRLLGGRADQRPYPRRPGCRLARAPEVASPCCGNAIGAASSASAPGRAIRKQEVRGAGSEPRRGVYREHRGSAPTQPWERTASTVPR